MGEGARVLKISLIVIVIIGFVFVFSSTLFPRGSLKDFYFIINWALPLLAALLIGIWVFSSQGFKNIWQGESGIKKFFSVVGGIILLGITAIVSWVIVAYIGFANGSYSSSTYGTPVYRPKVE